MKEHISITIDEKLVHLLRRYAKRERRSVSQVTETALREFLAVRLPDQDRIPTTSSAFAGNFSREDTYGR
jgi:predicted transcriptional regulator